MQINIAPNRIPTGNMATIYGKLKELIKNPIATIIAIPVKQKNIGHIKFIFCFTTAYSVSHCSFGFLKSIKKFKYVCVLDNKRCNIILTINTTGEIGHIISIIAKTINAIIVFIIISGIILYLNCLYSGIGIYFTNTAFGPSLEMAVAATYIVVDSNCNIPYYC